MSILGFSCTVMNTWEGELVYVSPSTMRIILYQDLTIFIGFSFKHTRMVVPQGLYTDS